MMDLLRSKKFQAAIVATIVAIAKHFIPQLDEAATFEVVMGLIVYIFAQGLADYRKEAAKLEASK